MPGQRSRSGVSFRGRKDKEVVVSLRQQTSSSSISKGLEIGDTVNTRWGKGLTEMREGTEQHTYISILIWIKRALSKITCWPCLLQSPNVPTRLFQRKESWKIAPRSHLMCSSHHQQKFTPRCWTASRLKQHTRNRRITDVRSTAPVALLSIKPYSPAFPAGRRNPLKAFRTR